MTAVLADRTLPHNLEAERVVLGFILLHDDALPRVAAILEPEDFYRDAHRVIFLGMKTLHARETPIDFVTLRHTLEATGHLDAVGGPVYLTSLVDGLPRGLHVEAWARIVKDLSIRRKMITSATNALTQVFDADADVGVAAARFYHDLAALSAEAARVTLPALRTARELVALPEPDASDQLLGALIIRGQRHLIGGHTGRGKTTFVLGLIKAMLTGTEYLGFTPHATTPRVLIIDAEQGLRTIKRRLREAGLQDRDDLLYLSVPGGLTLDTNGHERQAVEAELRNGHFDVVVASPLYKLHGGDSSEERAAVDLMKVFDRWRDLYNFASIFEMHCRKPPPVGTHLTMHDFFGSSAYLRGAEVVLGIDRLRPGASRLYFFKDRDGDLPAGQTWNLTFDRATGFARDFTVKESKATTVSKVAACLRQAPRPMTNAAIQTSTGCADRSVRDALKTLGAVETPGRDRNLKYYALPPELNLDGADDDGEDEANKQVG